MAKVMLVEDDDNLREIYGARLEAEGYTIVAAKDGEEALALAVKEKPDLIISDVMMPRISGFDMLDILRNAPETKETKVIMMTALSQAEDKARADKLGADRYLVKSQVTLEDVANVVKDVLAGEPEEPAPVVPATVTGLPGEAAAAPAPTPEPAAVPAPAPEPAPETAPTTPEVAPAPQPEPVAEPAPAAPAPAPEVAAAPVEPAPEPTIPEVVPIETPAEPAPTPTVDAIANPPLEVVGDDDSAVQTPPAAETAPEAAPAPAAEPELPPVVEPAAQQAAPIKVELPKPLNETAVASPAPDTDTPAATTSNDSTTEEESTTSIGPNLAEALAAEESQANSAPAAQEAEAPAIDTTPVAQVYSNGGLATTVIAPDPKPVEEPKAEAEEKTDDQPELPKTAVSGNAAGMKVIEPINDPNAKPDITALLEAEEKKAAVVNPPANTVITPKEEGGDTPPPAAPKNDVNNIAL